MIETDVVVIGSGAAGLTAAITARQLGLEVLVVENDEEQFGLIVDAIENIVTIDAGDKIGVPAILRHQIELPLRNDMREVVELSDQRTLLLLDASPLKQRLSNRALH